MPRHVKMEQRVQIMTAAVHLTSAFAEKGITLVAGGRNKTGTDATIASYRAMLAELSENGKAHDG